MRRIQVDGAKPYDVVLGAGALDGLTSIGGRLAVVVDENVARLHGERLRAILHGRPVEWFELPSGESQKSVSGAAKLWDWLAAIRLERSEHVVAIGGGVTGDLAGFAAATWRRGVPFVQVPTTLLAMVDSSVGGKVAIDHAGGKNLVGAFQAPVRVLADTTFLATLPERERWCGLAEVVKTALLEGEPLLALVERELDALGRGTGALEEVVAGCVTFKADVVRRDPEERGERAILNFGHTVGHALESLSQGELLHGEAVAWGLVAALELSGLASGRERRLVERLPLRPLPPLTIDDVKAAMASDKKVHGGRQRFVLLDAPGRVRHGVTIDAETLDAVLRGLLARGR